MKNTKAFTFRFSSARGCRAEILAAVYGEDESGPRFSRFKSLLRNPSAERLYFVLARHDGRPVALLQLCRERMNHGRFRIRGLYTHRRFRNCSLATRLLQLACKCVGEFQEGEEILSFILPTNLPSLVAHNHAGFLPATLQKRQPERHLCLAWSRQGGQRDSPCSALLDNLPRAGKNRILEKSYKGCRRQRPMILSKKRG